MATKNSQIKVHLPDVIGKGYGSFWHDRHRYRVLKGGRASKKSTTTALWFIYNLMKHPSANALVVRQTYNTHKDSTFATLQWACERLQVSHLWEFIKNPLECTYKPTGQKILFRGFDDPLKLTSITVPKGKLCWVWIEEAYEIEDEAEFRMLDESIRGELIDDLFYQITMTFNPWVNTHWTKIRFFDRKDPNAYTLTTTHWCNEFLDKQDHDLIEQLAEDDPDRYKVVGLGEYGIPGGAYFDEFRSDIHVCEPFEIPDTWTRYRALDYGLDMLAVLWVAVSPSNDVYVYKELHESDLIVSAAAARIIQINNNEKIRCTYAPGDLQSRTKDGGHTIVDLFNQHGVPFTISSNRRVQGWLSIKEALKVFDEKDVETGEVYKTSRLKIFKNCINLINYLPQIKRDEKDPNDCAIEPHYLTHICDALRYYCVTKFAAYQADEKPNRYEDNSYIDEFNMW